MIEGAARPLFSLSENAIKIARQGFYWGRNKIKPIDIPGGISIIRGMENALTDPTAAVEILRSFPADNTNPEDDYGQCFYQYEPSGKPACIVGTFLHAVGLPLPTGGDNKEAFSNLSENYPVSDTVRILLETVQTYADGGACWGDAIEDGYLAVQKYL